MSGIKHLLISLIGAVLIVSLAFFKGFNSGKEKVKYENLQDEVDDIQQTKKRRATRSYISVDDKRNWLQKYLSNKL